MLRFSFCCLRPCSRTSFHHQPEAQHPKSSAIHKLPADYPIYRWKTGQHMLNASFSHFDPTRTSVNLTAYVAPANPAGMVVLVDPFRGADMKRREFITLFGGAGPPQCRGERV